MNITFNPKKQFQGNKDVARELATVVASTNFHTSLSAALAQYTFAGNPSAEQLRAVKEFINVLLYLPFDDPPLPTLPMKQLDHTVYERDQPRVIPTNTKP